jgi:hypothetical protein
MSYHPIKSKPQLLIKMFPRKRILQGVVIITFIVGAVLISVGSAGAAAPLIVAGILLVMASGAGGFMVSMEPNAMSPITYRTPTAASA